MCCQYNADGNMITRNIGSTYNLAYDAKNRLTGVSRSTNARSYIMTSKYGSTPKEIVKPRR